MENNQYPTVLENKSKSQSVSFMPFRTGYTSIRIEPRNKRRVHTDFGSLIAPFTKITWKENDDGIIEVDYKKRPSYEDEEREKFGWPAVIIQPMHGTLTQSFRFRIRDNPEESEHLNLNRGLPTLIRVSPLNDNSKYQLWTTKVEVIDSFTIEGRIERVRTIRWTYEQPRPKKELDQIESEKKQLEERFERKKLSKYLRSIES